MTAMIPSFGNPPDRLSPAQALHLSQQAPRLLQKSLSAGSAFQIPFQASTETPETWTMYEHLLLSCLRTGDDKSAHLCLERLTDRFGSSNERVMSLRGLYQEAVAEDAAALVDILKGYEEVLAGDAVNTVRHRCGRTPQ